MGEKKPFKSKILELLRPMDTRELRRLDEYLSSPFFNKNQKIIQLFLQLKKQHPAYKRLYKEKIFQKVFPEKKEYHDGLLRALVADLTKLVENYISQTVYENQTRLNNNNLLEGMLMKGMYDHFENRLKKTLQQIEEEPDKDAEFYYYKFLIERESYRFTTVTNNRATTSSLQEVVNNLDLYYLAAKLKYTALVLNRQNIVGSKYELKLVDEILYHLKMDKTHRQVPFIRLYHRVVLMLKEFENEEHFRKFKIDLAKFKSEIPKGEIRFLYTLMLNYARWKIYAGKPEYSKESFEVYKLLLEEKVIIVGKTISYHHFRNIVNVAVQVEEYDWAELFIKNYKPLVIPGVRENVFSFNMAALLFAKNQFEDALDYLRAIQFSDVEFIDFYYHMYYKTLLIQTSFELDETEVLLSNLESFRLYLSRNKVIPDDIKLAYANFIKLVRKLTNLRLGKRISMQKLAEEIQSTKPLTKASWLEETIGRTERPKWAD